MKAALLVQLCIAIKVKDGVFGIGNYVFGIWDDVLGIWFFVVEKLVLDIWDEAGFFTVLHSSQRW